MKWMLLGFVQDTFAIERAVTRIRVRLLVPIDTLVRTRVSYADDPPVGRPDPLVALAIGCKSCPDQGINVQDCQ